jgi:cytosine/adenosine deaminase-related metal-dependent hydrolase
MADVVRRLEHAQAAAPATFDIGLAPHAPYTVSSRLYQAVSALARERGLKVMSHVAESQDELTYIRSGSGKFAHDYREKMGWERMLVQPYGVTPIKYLQQWDVLHPDFLAVHCVNVTRDDIRILRAEAGAVAHCPRATPSSVQRRPLTDLLRGRARRLGTDSPASSNIMDMFDEMRTMLFLHRAVERDVSVLDAQKCVRIATLGGAEALGMEAEVGSLEPGKWADLIAVDVSRSHFAPIADPYSALVYGANQDDVTLTVVGGRDLFRDRGLVDVDAAAIRARAVAVREASGPCAPARRSRRARLAGGVTPVHREETVWCCSIAARSSSGRRSSSGTASSWPPSSSSGTGVLNGCTWLNSSQQDVTEDLNQQIAVSGRRRRSTLGRRPGRTWPS